MQGFIFLLSMTFLNKASAAVPDLLSRTQGVMALRDKLNSLRRQRNSSEESLVIFEEASLGDIPLTDILEATPSPQKLKLPFEKACINNEVMRIIELYEGYQTPQYENFLPYFLFPDKILDSSPYDSLSEENSATQLAVLLAAIEGNREAQVLVFSYLKKTGYNFSQEQFDAYYHRVISQFDKARSSETNKRVLEFYSIFSMQQSDSSQVSLSTKEEVDSPFALTVRSLVRLSTYYFSDNLKHAFHCLKKAAERGSHYAVIQMYRLMIADKNLEPDRQSKGIQNLLLKYADRIGGYDFLLLAYAHQFGLDGYERDLTKSNDFYKKAIDAGCREAAYEYGEFLIQLADSLPKSDPRYNRFYEHSVDAYEKAGDYGLVMGFIKAAKTIKTMLLEAMIEQERQGQFRERMQNLLIKASVIALDDIVVECCAGMMDVLSSETVTAVRSNNKKIQEFFMPKMNRLFPSSPQVREN